MTLPIWPWRASLHPDEEPDDQHHRQEDRQDARGTSCCSGGVNLYWTSLLDHQLLVGFGDASLAAAGGRVLVAVDELAGDLAGPGVDVGRCDVALDHLGTPLGVLERLAVVARPEARERGTPPRGRRSAPRSSTSASFRGRGPTTGVPSAFSSELLGFLSVACRDDRSVSGRRCPRPGGGGGGGGGRSFMSQCYAGSGPMPGRARLSDRRRRIGQCPNAPTFGIPDGASRGI